jgi:hypothetical protein
MFTQLKMKKLIGLSRCRNESLIAEDTIKHFSQFCDSIIILDDASEDNTVDIVGSFNKVEHIIRNNIWNPNQMNVETSQRNDLLEHAKTRYSDVNFIYFDFDERIEFDFNSWDGESAVVMKLFDARMTEEDQDPYTSGELKGFRKYFDPIFRKIPFIFNDKAKYINAICQRFPAVSKQQNVILSGYVQHYGKSLSKDHWQETCDYYSKYFPVFAKKWEARKKENGVVGLENLLTWDQCLLR